ncbi:MAG: preprotein translocase subunit SecA [Spirochaetales bacterium]|nr:MAG: preprotein translocase subunit SecA [Spirochaetales bacterium]
MGANLLTALLGSQHERNLRDLLPVLHRINQKEAWAAALSPGEFQECTRNFRERCASGESLDDILPEAFALVREASRRTLGERHYDVQLLGGVVLHQGKIMEMKTGEGKTLSSVTAAYLNCITGKGVHVVTVNDYLAGRDAEWMGPVYSYLGVSVSAILSDMDNDARKQAYEKDITYGTNNEFGFDYLRDNMRWDRGSKVQRGHNYCIIDEIDSILIDEARTPLIISGGAEDDTVKFYEVNKLVPGLVECEKDEVKGEYPENAEGDFKLDEKSKRVTFTDQGINHIEALLEKRGLIRGSLVEESNFEYIHYVTQAMKARHLFHKDVDYVVQQGEVQIVDEFTGRILTGRRYSEGLHQAIEAKEQIRIAKRNRTLATITFQNYFRMYGKISGMTGTADTEAKEFSKIYNLDVVVIPTNRPVVRDDENDVIYFNEDLKFNAICEEIARVHKKGQPMLVGTISIEKSEKLSSLLTKRGIRHEILNAKNHAREALIISEAGAKGSVTIATNMAGRGTDIKLGGNPEYRARKTAGTEAKDEDYRKALDKEFTTWRKDYEEVKTFDGLYVLGTERHEARRIDNQLRGRSGRQGDPGTSRFFISLDDELMRLFGGENFKTMMGRLGMKEGEPLVHPWINKAIERAQTRVEERNYEIRKHLLDYDDVLNEQRKFIYSQRDAILEDDHLHERVLTTAEEITEELLDTHVQGNDVSENTFRSLAQDLKENFFYAPSQESAAVLKASRENFRKQLIKDLRTDIEDKMSKVGSENFNNYIRFEYLRNIDSRWQDHLESLEALREAVYLRSYGQKNPLLEYKLEGFEIFDKLIQDIRTAIARKIIKVQIKEYSPSGQVRNKAQEAVAAHRQFGQFGGAGAAAQASHSGSGMTGPAREATPEKVQIKRTYPKVGRNDACPCGSGKKYKYCHGM